MVLTRRKQSWLRGGVGTPSALSRLEKLVSGVVVFVEGADDVCFSEEYTIFNRKVNALALEWRSLRPACLNQGARSGLVLSCWF